VTCCVEFFNIQEHSSCWNLGWHYSPASYTEVLYCDLLKSQTDLHLASFFPQCFSIVLKISFSNSLPTVDKRLIGHNFWRNFESLLGFGRVTILYSFQCDRKWLSQRQGLNKYPMLNAKEVFLEDTGDIHLECQQNHMPFLISRIMFLET
jgi:hypothetical protein